MLVAALQLPPHSVEKIPSGFSQFDLLPPKQHPNMIEEFICKHPINSVPVQAIFPLPLWLENPGPSLALLHLDMLLELFSQHSSSAQHLKASPN